MRESQPLTRNETPSQRMRRIKKNIQIRKEKLYGIQLHSEQSTESEHKQPKEPCKQDKNYRQKLKNRQAAQKSREQKKLYTSKLEEQIQRLKLIMGRCHECRHQVENSQSEVDNTRDDSASRQMNEVDSILDDVIPESENSFYRMRSNSEDSSIGIYLFVFMIIIGVFCMGTRFDSSGSTGPFRRDLMKKFISQKNTEFNSQSTQSQETSSQLQKFRGFDTNMNPTYSTHSDVDVDPSKYQNGLLSMDQVKSPTSILDDKVFEKIITAFENYKLVQYDDKNLRSKSGLIDANKSLMFCTRPKIYKAASNGQGIMTTFLDIFVQGVEIVNILSTGQSNSLTPGSLQLDGLYKITASVEEIEEIPNPNLVY